MKKPGTYFLFAIPLLFQYNQLNGGMKQREISPAISDYTDWKQCERSDLHGKKRVGKTEI